MAAILIEYSDYLSSEWWTPTDLREVLADLTEPIKVLACERALAPLLRQVASCGFSELAVRKLQERLAIVGDLDAVLLDDDKLVDGRHPLETYARAGRTTIPVVDIGPLLRTDWEKWMNG
jgi:hypothetical protein